MKKKNSLIKLKKRPMNNNALLYTYEAVTIVILIIVAVYFLTATAPTPTISHSIRYHQLKTQGDDALRSADYTSLLYPEVVNAVESSGGLDSLVDFLNDALSNQFSVISFNIFIDGTPYYESGEPADSTVSSHRIIVNSISGKLYDIQLLMWYKTL